MRGRGLRGRGECILMREGGKGWKRQHSSWVVHAATYTHAWVVHMQMYICTPCGLNMPVSQKDCGLPPLSHVVSCSARPTMLENQAPIVCAQGAGQPSERESAPISGFGSRAMRSPGECSAYYSSCTPVPPCTPVSPCTPVPPCTPTRLYACTIPIVPASRAATS